MILTDAELAGLPLSFCRAAGLCAVLPLGELDRSWGARLLLALVLGLGTVPSETGVVAAVTAPALLVASWNGILLGIPCAVLISAVAAMGELLDSGRGQTLAQAFDPISNTPQSTTATLLSSWSWALVLAAGGAEMICRALRASVETSTLLPGVLFGALQILSGAFSCVLPILCCFAIVEVSAGWFGRLVPGLQLHLEIFSIKSLLAGAAVLLVSRIEFGQALLSLCSQATP